MVPVTNNASVKMQVGLAAGSTFFTVTLVAGDVTGLFPRIPSISWTLIHPKQMEPGGLPAERPSSSADQLAGFHSQHQAGMTRGRGEKALPRLQGPVLPCMEFWTTRRKDGSALIIKLPQNSSRNSGRAGQLASFGKR